MNTHTEKLAAFAAELRFESIPPEVVHQAERLILDTCCCAIGGHLLDNGKLFLSVLESLGGKAEATLLPTGQKTSVATAAFVNTELSNLLDLDDNLLYFTHFANASVMPALAMAERQGAGGKELVTAVIAAYEVTARIYLSHPSFLKIVSPPPDVRLQWPNRPFGHSFNTFGAASGSGKVLGLNAEEMANAMGIAGYTAPLPTIGKAYSGRRLTGMKYIAYGWMGWSGVIAALLAKDGLTGDTSVLDGDQGFWRMSGEESCDFSMLTREMGTKWWIMDTSFKPYPAGTWMRNSMLALDKVLAKNDIKAEEIEKIVVKTWRLTDKDSPFNQAEPKSYLDTQVSYPYLLVMRALRVPANRWHAREVYTDPQALGLLKKIQFESSPEATLSLYKEITTGVRRASKCPATVDVHARGKVYSEHAEYAKGDPFTEETRLSDEELAEKFRTHTSDLIRSEHIERAIESLLNMSKVADVRSVIPLLTA